MLFWSNTKFNTTLNQSLFESGGQRSITICFYAPMDLY